jgi:hypothetical protein
MKLLHKGVTALILIFVAAGVYSLAYACDGTRTGSESKTMDASGRGGFKRSCDQNFGGREGGGHHGGGHEGRHEGRQDGEHHGKHHGGNRQESSGSGNQEQTGGSNQNIDFSSYTDSASLDTAAWEALNAKDYGRAEAFAQETITRYSAQAKEQQASLSNFAPAGSEAEYWALNDVGTAYFISGSAYQAQGNTTKAREQYNTIISQYKYAQAFDPAQDLYWHVAEAAQKALDSL